MKMKKIMLTAAAAVTLAMMGFTSCELALGKDDFFGTWTVHYTVDGDNVAQGTGENGDGTTENRNTYDYLESDVNLVMYFDGNSEDLFNGSDQDTKEDKFKSAFWQYKIRDKDEKVAGGKTYPAFHGKTFWCGSYELKDNSNYTRGTLILDYKYGFSDVTPEKAEELANYWTGAVAIPGVEELSGKEKREAIANWFAAHATTVVKSTNPDIQTFDFKLTGAKLSGYTKMRANTVKGCDWEVTERNFDLVGKKSDLMGALENLGVIESDAEDPEEPL